ncbi:MAG: Na+/H+ antiporter NhaA [Methylotenera sp.]|nr:MAG: Na+/H+ antiporter NhaA [Methylotenera sp.]
MAISNKNQQPEEAGVIYAPWEKTFSRVLSPIEEFIHHQTASSILLILATALALFLANSSAFGEWYQHLLHVPLSFTLSDLSISMSLHHWVNDALMAIFFFVVGMELKREIMVGELSDIRQASLPIIAAIGGMVVPALIYATFNPNGDANQGWGVPMATDIAFAVGALVLLAKRVPKSLVAFLIALAIADDLGAVLVIALFYTEQIAMNWLIISALLVTLLLLLNFSGVRKTIPYLIVAMILWYAMLQSGVHATLAGVLGAFTVPTRSKYDPALFLTRIKDQITNFASHQKAGTNLMTNDKLHSVIENIEDSVMGVQSPLQRLEEAWHIPVAFLIIPIFAFFNAGITVQLDSLGETFSHPVMLGVMLGLVIGKFVGITGACWLALKLKIGRLPTGARFSQIAAVSVLAGIGFTMSIFIAELAFKGHADYLLMAKTGVIFGSLIAAALGFCWLWVLGQSKT